MFFILEIIVFSLHPDVLPVTYHLHQSASVQHADSYIIEVGIIASDEIVLDEHLNLHPAIPLAIEVVHVVFGHHVTLEVYEVLIQSLAQEFPIALI